MKALEKIALWGFVLTLVLITGILSGALPGIARRAAPASLPPPPLDQWKTYTDERFHFSFRYPPDWYLKVIPALEGGGGVQISTYDLEAPPFKETPPPDWFKMEILVPIGWPIAPGQSLEEWAQARRVHDPCKFIGEERVTVANLDALKETTECSPGRQSLALYIPYSGISSGDTVLIISVSSFQQSILSEIFWQIVSTFQLVK